MEIGIRMDESEMYAFPDEQLMTDSFPVKRVFDIQLLKLKEIIKFPREIEVEEDKETLFMPTVVGIDYRKDFELFKIRSCNTPKSFVPGNKAVGEVIATSSRSPLSTGEKYLLFPYSICLYQDVKPCVHCQYLRHKRIRTLDYTTLNVFKNHRCLNHLEYGVNVDGSLQDYMKLKDGLSSLIQIPKNVDLNDACFIFDILLPLYLYLMDHFVSKAAGTAGNDDMLTKLKGKLLILVRDFSDDINDVHLVLDVISVNRTSVTIIDDQMLRAMEPLEKSKLCSTFNYMFLISVSAVAKGFAELCCKMRCAVTNKADELNIIVFNQHTADDSLNSKVFGNNGNKIKIFEFRLKYTDKLHAISLLDKISRLNSQLRQKSVYPQSVVGSFNSSSSDTGDATSGSTESNISISSQSIPSPRTPKNNDSSSFKSEINHEGGGLWLDTGRKCLLKSSYEIDDNPCLSFARSTIEEHDVSLINFMIYKKNQGRICYVKPPRKKQLNAIIV